MSGEWGGILCDPSAPPHSPHGFATRYLPPAPTIPPQLVVQLGSLWLYSLNFGTRMQESQQTLGLFRNRMGICSGDGARRKNTNKNLE